MKTEWNYWSNKIASGGSHPKGSTLIANSQRPPASSDNNPVQALADDLVGFSEVYSRIEVAKMELFTKMNLELARLRKRRRKNGGSGSVSGFSSVSVSSSSASSDSEEE